MYMRNNRFYLIAKQGFAPDGIGEKNSSYVWTKSTRACSLLDSLETGWVPDLLDLFWTSSGVILVHLKHVSRVWLKSRQERFLDFSDDRIQPVRKANYQSTNCVQQAVMYLEYNLSSSAGQDTPLMRNRCDREQSCWCMENTNEFS